MYDVSAHTFLNRWKFVLNGVITDDGSMKKDDREKALTKIRESSTTRVILISFKAGSTGTLSVIVYRLTC
jgi:hypothetical protein